MTTIEAEKQLASEGLRIAKNNEAGWAWKWVHEDGYTVCWWVTEAEDTEQ